MRPILAAAALSLLAGCAGTPLNRPVEVLRYHLGDSQVGRGTIALTPPASSPAGFDWRAFADGVSAELTRNGYTVVDAAATPRYLATVEVRRGVREAPDTGPRFSVGIGGATFGRHTGIGGGVSAPVAGGGLRDIVGTELNVKITDGVVWEGHARSESDRRLADASPGGAAQKLAGALFQGFPGESGRTITVK